MSEESSNWRDLLILLQGNHKAGIIAVDVIVENIEKCVNDANNITDNECYEHIQYDQDLADIFHELCTDVLQSSNWSTRVNAGHAICKLTEKYSNYLTPLLSLSSNDGQLLLLDELDIQSIIKYSDTSILLSSSSSSLLQKGTLDELYNKNWLTKQRKLLQKKLGIEALSENAEFAMKYIDENVLIDEEDIIVNKNMKKRKRKNEYSSDEYDTITITNGNNENSNINNATNETWIARLIRFLVVGLLDSRWETRHGCSIGLTSFINGLYPSMKHDETNHEKNTLNNKYTLPWFIVEDIICSGIGVLIYDQFLDFGLGISAVSPVKEACGQLIASAARTCDAIVINSIYHKLYDICNSLSNFNVRCGGLIALKYFIAVHGSLLFTDTTSNNNDKSLSRFIILVKSFLIEQYDDLNNVACSLVKSIYYAINSIKKLNLQFHLKLDHFSFLYDLLVGVNSTAIRLGPLSGSLLNLADSTHICAKEYSQMNMILNDDKDIHKCYLLLIQVISTIFIKLYQYSEDLRLKTIIILVDSLESISIPICSTKVTPTEYSNVTALFFSSILISFSCRSGGSLGDLFLVNKVDQDRKDYDSPHSTSSSNIDDNDYIDGDTKILVITEGTAKVLTKTILQLLRHLIVSHRNESLEEFEITEISYNILMFLIRTMLLGTSDRATLICIDKAPKKRKKNGSASYEEIKNGLVSQLTDSIQKFQVEFSMNTNTNTNTSISRFELISFSDSNSRAGLAHLVGSLLSHAHSLLSNSNTSSTNNLYVQFFLNITEQLILVSNEMSRMNDDDKPKKKKFQFIVIADDADSCKPLSSSTSSTANIIFSNRESNVSDMTKIVEVLIMIMIIIFARSTVHDNDNDAIITTVMKNINTLSNADTNVRSTSNVLKLTEALECFYHHDVSRVLNLINNHDDEDNMMLSLTTMMAAALYISNFHDESLEKNDPNIKILTDTVVTLLNSPQQHFVNTFIYFLARLLNHNIYSTIISPDNIFALPSSSSLSSSLSSSSSSWNISATLSFLLASLKGVDDTTKKNLIVDEDFCRRLITATVSSASNDYTDNHMNNDNMNNNDDDDNGEDDEEKNKSDNNSIHNDESNIIMILISIIKTLLSRMDSISLHGFLKTIMITLKSCIHSDDEGSRIASSKVFLELLILIQEKVLSSYNMAFSVALRGLGDYSDRVRRLSAKSLRILVALSPLVRNKNDNNIENDNMGEQASNIFKTKLISNSPSDAPIIDFLRNVTNLLICDSSNSTDQRPPIPGLCPDGLRDYQWEGVSWLTQLRRVGLSGILADDMGIGKTVQALAALAILRLENMINSNTNPNFNAHPFLIICPSMLLLHWEQEIKKFFLPAIFAPKRYVPGETYDNSIIVIMSYDSIKIDYEQFLKNQVVFDAIVLDEAHVIRNPKTAVSKAVFSLKAKFRVALSGTPIQNKIEEIWSLFNFLIPDFLGNFKEFNKNYILPIKKSIKERSALNVDGVKVDDACFQYSINISTEGMAVLRKLHKIILPFILRRTKNMVARELPSKTIIDIYCPLSITQKRLYVDFQKKLRICDTKLEEELLSIRNQELISVSKKSKTISDENTEPLNPLKAFFYLRYLCVHPSLVIAKLHKDYRNRLVSERGVSGKMDRLARLLIDSQIILEQECDNVSDLPVVDDDVADLEHYKKQKTYESSSDDDDNTNEDIRNDKNYNDSNHDTNANMTERKHFIKIAKPGNKIDENNNDLKSKAYDKSSKTNTKISYHRALLFVHHKETLSLIEECIMKRYFSKVRYARLDGSMNPKRRSEIAHEFNTQSADDAKNDIRILMMTTKACGLGLNLTAADTVIFLEHDWNPYVDMQAMDRAHRIGQKMPVTVYRLIAESTIEARVLGLQHHKLTLANEIINDENTNSTIDKDIGTSTLLKGTDLSNPTRLPTGNRNTNDDYDTMDLDNFLASIGCD